jgi:hypothetical protein
MVYSIVELFVLGMHWWCCVFRAVCMDKKAFMYIGASFMCDFVSFKKETALLTVWTTPVSNRFCSPNLHGSVSEKY